MNHKLKIYNVFLVLIIALITGLMLLSGCGEKEKIVTEIVRDTITVTVNDTIVLEIISVDSIYSTPDNITQGQSVELTVAASKNPMAGNLTYSWFAEAGELSATEGDTVTWKAPDDEGAYLVSVHATDGEYIAIGVRLIGVGMYAPTATPYYVGGQGTGCTCHQTTVDSWTLTAHAHAWETLQNSGHPAPYCNPCHTVGYEGDPGNSGYDEAPIALFENVQCENCHGPASAHPANPTGGTIEVSYDPMNCGVCHEGEHHPYITEWEESPHNFNPNDPDEHWYHNPSCEGCHDGVGALERLSGDLSTFYGAGTVIAGRDTLEYPWSAVVCQTCHDPHSEENPGQLRTVADVPLVTANGESPVITEGGAGKLCMHCHHARRGPESQIASGYAHFGPHANPQADILAGKSAFHGVADPGFVWAGPSHLLVQNSCKTCHLNTIEYGAGPGGAAVTGHKFEPTVEACAGCHGTITSFTDIMATDDFDGDGTIEGVQLEVEGLLDLLVEALVADGLDTLGVGVAGALGDTLLSTQLQRESGYNWAYVEDDKSMGIHNPDYVVQLLQQSYKHLTGSLPVNAVIAREDNAVVAPF